jgi:hypothetical protein
VEGDRLTTGRPLGGRRHWWASVTANGWPTGMRRGKVVAAVCSA